MFKAKPLKANKSIPRSLGSSAKRHHPGCFSVSQGLHLNDRSGGQPSPSIHRSVGGSLFSTWNIHLMLLFFYWMQTPFLPHFGSGNVSDTFLCFTVFSHFTHFFQDASVLHIWLPLCLLRYLLSYKHLLIYILCQALEKILLIHTILDL